MHTSKFPVIGFALLGIVGCFTPWAHTLKYGEYTQINGLCFAEGGITVCLFFLIGLLSAFKTRTANLLNSYYKTIAVLSSLLVLVTLYKIIAISGQTARIASYGIDVKGITKYQPATGLFLSMTAAAAILLYMAVQLFLRYRKVIIPANWLESMPAGRFYLPAHHNTSL